MELDRDSVHIRLLKVAGQVSAIDRMIAEGDSAERILVQINAAKSALHKVALFVTEDALSDLLGRDEGKSGDAAVVIERFSSLL